jgi:cytidyltransferase-like protein
MVKIVYIDGVFDLFHRGHLESLRKAKYIFNDPDNTFLLVGVVSDADCMSYKRKPIINENDRLEIIKNMKIVDDVVFPCPLFITKQFIDTHNIDIVVHGFSNDNDRNKQYIYFADIIKSEKFKEIEYYDKISTTDIIKRIKNFY